MDGELKMALTDHELDVSVSIGTEDLTAVTDIDPEDAEILGHAVTYTIGDFEVPREWLVERMGDMEFPDWMIPKEPTKKRAYNRVRDRLVDVDKGHDDIMVTVGGESREARVFTKKVSNETFQIDVDVFFEANGENAKNGGPDHGDWRTQTLGYVTYLDDGGVLTRPQIEHDNSLWTVWENYAGLVTEQLDHYRHVHLGGEFQKLMGRVVKHWTESVKLRSAGAVYFTPARHAGTMEKLGTLFAEMDELFKDSGSRLEVNTIPVISDEQRREMVAERAEEELETRVGNAVETIEEEVAEADDDLDDDELVSDLVGVFEQELDEIEDFTAEYNALLEAELEIRDIIAARRGDVVPEVEEVIDEVGF